VGCGETCDIKHGPKTVKPFEVAVGAILTQNTAWKNVESALLGLARADLLSPHAIFHAPDEILERCIKPAGYFRQKSKKLKLFSEFVLETCQGDLKKLRAVRNAREQLLALWGIGRETADTILLYALNKPSFVVDAYTRRLFYSLSRDQEWLRRDYDDLRAICEAAIPKSVKRWQDAHALIVYWGQNQRNTPKNSELHKNGRPATIKSHGKFS
ncbi:MAG TPA: hypothetical protein VFQ60_03675, partial [Patescibacteria group bacterium]|nr:hypothetical protein [Patescibacteria group bacterium]